MKKSLFLLLFIIILPRLYAQNGTCFTPTILNDYQRTAWVEPEWSDFRYPEVDFENLAAETRGGILYDSIVPMPSIFIREHALEVAKTLYRSSKDPVPAVKRIRYTIEDTDGISAKDGAPPVVSIFYSSRWVAQSMEQSGEKGVLYETRGVLFHELTHAYQLEPQGIGDYGSNKVFWAFIEGMADAVRYHNGFFPVESRKKGGHWMDGYRTTGFFLEWLTAKDPDFLRKFNASTLHTIPWSFDGGMQYVFGPDATTEALWNEYQEFLE